MNTLLGPDHFYLRYNSITGQVLIIYRFLRYPSIQDRDIPSLLADGKIDPTRLPMWDKCCYIREKRCYIRDNLHATFDVMTFQIIG